MALLDLRLHALAVETANINSAKALSWTPTTSAEAQGKSAFLPFAIRASLDSRVEVYNKLSGMNNRCFTSQDVEFS